MKGTFPAFRCRSLAPCSTVYLSSSRTSIGSPDPFPFGRVTRPPFSFRPPEHNVESHFLRPQATPPHTIPLAGVGRAPVVPGGVPSGPDEEASETTRRPPRRAKPGPKRVGAKNRPTAARRKPASTQMPPSRREVSAGGVVYRRTRKGASVARAARREVREETGLEAMIEASLGTTRYFYVWDGVRVRKSVHFFLMRATGGDVRDRDEEMEDVRWFPLDRALKEAAYRGERVVLARAAELLS